MNALSRTFFGQKASLIFVGANEGLITQGFEPLLGENRIVLINYRRKIIAIHYLSIGGKKNIPPITIHRWAIYAYSLSIDTLFIF